MSPEHLVKVLEFLARENHHFLDKYPAVWVVAHQGQCRRRGLSLAGGMVEHEGIEVAEDGFEPFGGTGDSEFRHDYLSAQRAEKQGQRSA